LKLTFGDADSQQFSPASKRFRLITDSIDHLADLREQPSQSSSIPSPEDKSPRKFRLLFGGSSEELSQPLSPRDEDDGDAVDNADSDVTSQTKSSSDSDTLKSDDDGGKAEGMMTQADEEAMKTFVPLNAGALSYISDDGDDNILDFFLKPLDTRPRVTNCCAVQGTLNGQSQPSILDAAADASDVGVRSERVKSSRTLRTSFVSTDQHTDTGKALIDSMLLCHTPASNQSNAKIQLTPNIATRIPVKSAFSREDAASNTNGESYLSCMLSSVIRPTVAEGCHGARSEMVDLAQFFSQGSDEFRTPASQNSSVVVVDADVTSRSAGSQPLKRDIAIDVSYSPVRNSLRTAGTLPPHFASDATTTDGQCTPCKSSVPQSLCHRQLNNIRSLSGQLNRISDDRSVVNPPNACSELVDVNSDACCTALMSYSVPDAVDHRQSPSLVKSVDPHSSCGPTQFSSRSSVSVQLVQLCRGASSRDHYDGDVDSDCDDVISSCVRRCRRRCRRSRSTSRDAIVISSDSSSDQSTPPRTSRDPSDQSPSPRTSRDCLLGKDGVRRDSESEDGAQNETDNAAGVDIERSPVLFSEPFV